MRKNIIFIVIVFAMILTLCGSVSAADTSSANFTSNVTNGSAPLSVQFNDTSAGTPTSWSWDFGDNSTSTEQNPVHNYTKNGIYNVNLTVFKDDGNNSLTRSNYITVLPTVNASLTGGTYNTAQTVTLTSNDPTATIYYANDTTDPRTSGTRTEYTGSITINKTTTLRYAAVDSSGNWSSLYLQNYVIGNGGLANASWPKYQVNANNTGQSIYTGPQTGNLKWNYTIGSNIYYGSPVIGADGTIYIGSSDYKLYAINPNGTLKWTYTTGNRIYGSAAIGADGTVYVGSYDKKLYALNPDGTLKWNYTTGSYIYGSPAIGADGTIYIGSYDKNIYAINPDGTLKWNYTTGNYIYYGTPAIGADGTVYVGSYDKKLYALNPDGTLKWNYTTGNTISGSAAIGADGTIYVCDASAKLYAINPDGSQKWISTTALSTQYASSPVIGTDGTIYIGSNDGKIYAINQDGSKKWTYTTGSYIYGSPVIGADGTIYVGSNDYKLYALNSNGTLKWNYSVGNWIYGSPAIGADGTLYMGSYTSHNLYAFNAVDFQANATTGTNGPLTVQFTDKTPNSPTAWLWDFGDGTTSTEQNPKHTYSASNSGYYTVKLNVTFSNSSNGYAVKQDYIKVYNRPIAVFSTNTTAGLVPSTVQFNDTTLNIPTSWLWDFGDGTNSTLQNPTHTYTSEGNYSVSLTVNNPAGTTTLIIPSLINVSLPSVPVTDFTSNVTSAQAPVTVQFTDKSTGYIINSWLWDFGDGTNSTLQNPTHTYAALGNYNVSLTAGNAGGNTTTTKLNYISVLLPSPTPNFSADKYWGINNVTVHFTDNSTYSPTSWLWNFGDGTTSTEQNPTHTYSSIGSYNVTLTATNSVGSKTMTIPRCINVLNSSAVLSSNNGVTFYVANDAGVKYDIANGVNHDAPDGSSNYQLIYVPDSYYLSKGAGGTNPIQLSTDPTLIPGLNVPSSFTNTTNMTGTFYVVFRGGIQHLDDAILMLAVNGTIPDNFNVTITSSGYTYTLPVPATTNPTVASLTNITYVTNALNETFNKSDFIYQQNWRPYNQVNYPIYNGENVSDPNNQFHLMFIDLNVGAFCSGQIPDEINNGAITVTYSFNNLNSFAAFAVYGWFSACNWGTGIPQSSYNAICGYNVIGMPPAANFTANTTVSAVNAPVKFTDTSANLPSSWLWDFGDGTTSTEQNPTHTYTTAGIYTVTLKASNGNGDNTIVMSNFITVGLPVANFKANATTGNNSMSVQFNDTSRNTPTSWLWDFGDGSTSTDQNPNHTYAKPGIYDVTLTVTNSYGTDSEVKTGYINIVDTIPNVTASVTGGLYNSTQTVSLTTDDNTATIYYTLNGTTKKYTDPIVITNTTTLSYVAVDNTGNWSPIYMQTYTIDTTAPIVTANETTGVYNTAQSVSLTSDDSAATIYYTTDGSDPQTSSIKTKYNGAIIISSTTTLKYSAVDVAGNWATVQSQTYTIDTTAPIVSANETTGVYNTAQSVALTSDDADSTIYYTTDGSDPQTSSTKTKYNGAIIISSTTTLKYTAVDAVGNWASTQEQTYTIDTIAPVVSANETTGVYNTAQSVSLTSDDSSATIYYTTDGSDPTTSSTRTEYNGAIAISSTTTLKYSAVDAVGNWATVQSQTYTIDITAPIVSANETTGAYNTAQSVTLTATDDTSTTIYYTTDGSDPQTSSTRSVYVGAVAIDSTTTLKYTAVDAVGNWAPIQEQTYTIDITAPIVTGSDPVNFATGVSTAKDITVTFSEPIKAGDLSKITLQTSNGAVVPITASVSGNTLTISHSALLANGTFYKIFLNAGCLIDSAGNPLQLKVLGFTTVDDTAPIVTSSNPANFATNVARDKTITVTFSKPIKAGDLSKITLQTSDGKVVPITASISGNTLTISHSALLSSGTFYKLFLDTGCLTDLDGNSLQLKVLGFTTVDDTAPIVTGSDPVNFATGVSTAKDITVTFSEPIKAGDLSKITLQSSTGTVIPVTTSVSGNKLTISHSALLASGTFYKIFLNTGCLTDLAGNSLQIKVLGFTTST